MKFISYAQNFEDVMLHRALGFIERGFYVDVGAQHPEIDSVTKAFHERGWSGINIEPVPHWHRMLCEDRPRDINLNIAVGSAAGMLEFYAVEDTGLSTADPAMAERYRLEGRNVSRIEAAVRTLTDVLNEHPAKDIHFLKIDVEGFERQVIEGLDLKRHRPWILVIEATLPNSREQRFSDWEPMVVSNGYQLVYFDGLNRFYVADEKQELAKHFNAPPNVFDSFVTRSEKHWADLADERGHLAHHFTWHSRDLAERLSRELARERAAFERTTAKFHESWANLERDLHWNQQELARLQSILGRLQNSVVWKAVVPLRFVFRLYRRVRERFARAAGPLSSRLRDERVAEGGRALAGGVEPVVSFRDLYVEIRKTRMPDARRPS